MPLRPQFSHTVFDEMAKAFLEKVKKEMKEKEVEEEKEEEA